VVLLGLVGQAFADTDIEQADKLFAEGLALRDTNLQQSCDKFSQSLKLNPQAIGTLMNVALCDEKLGRIASAVDHFSEARDRAKEGNLPEYLTEAQAHIDKLTPDLPFVVVKLAVQADPTTRVLINDRVLANEKIQRGDKIPVDPGELHIVVSAKDRLPYEGTVMIAKKETKTIEVPELKKSVTVKSSRRTIGIITTASGGALVAAGIVIGLFAKKKYDGAFDDGHCNAMTKICDPDGHSTTESAITLGWVGTGVGAVGIATAGVGLFLWLTAPKDKDLKERNVSVLPTVTPEGAGLSAFGRF
jgi:tetratricopeptide (TPR) repeat protein